MDTICPPLRWNMVEIGVSRGAYPVLRNFRHLSRMRLKTIVSLIPEPPSADLIEFAKMAGIELVFIQTNRSGPMVANLQQSLVQAVNVCINEDRHPVYVHCLDGRRISGLVVLYLRRLQGWTPISAIAEYWRYQTTMRPPVPSLEIDKMSRELEKFASEFGEIIIPGNIPRWLWGTDKNRNSAVSGIKLKYVPPLKTIVSEPPSTGIPGVTTGFKGETDTLEQSRLAYAYLSFLDHDEEHIPKLGPGATKALEILRSHSNTPMHYLGEAIKVHTSSSSARNHLVTSLDSHPLLQSPISRTLDALSLPGLEGLSSRPFRGKKVYNGTIAGAGGSNHFEQPKRGRHVSGSSAQGGGHGGQVAHGGHGEERGERPKGDTRMSGYYTHSVNNDSYNDGD